MADFETTILQEARANHWKTVRDNEFGAWYGGDGVDSVTDDKLDEFYGALLGGGGIANRSPKKEAVELVQRHTKADTRAYATNVLLYQTALRAADPDCMNQGHYGFCGPTSILYHFAKNCPDKYAQCVLDLHDNRRGTLLTTGALKAERGLEVRADEHYDSDYSAVALATTQLGPADFVILHAIRRAAQERNVSAFAIASPGQDSEATEPGAMKRLLERAGYREVTDKTLWNGHGKAPGDDLSVAAHVSECGTLTRSCSGPVVIMLCHPWLSVAAKAHKAWADFTYSNGGKEPQKLADLHWISVNRLEKAGQNYNMKFMTWGDSYYQQYTAAHFRHCYYGYISAKP